MITGLHQILGKGSMLAYLTYIRNHDIILYYLMSSESAQRFNKEYIPYAEDYVRRDGFKPPAEGFPSKTPGIVVKPIGWIPS